MASAIAENRYVTRTQLLEFIRPQHHGILATTRRDGRPQLSPVTMGLDDAGRIVVATYPERAKARNVRRNAAVSICVISEDFGDEWVQIYGSAEVLDLPDALPQFVEYYRNIAGEHPDWDEYRKAMVDQGKVLIRVEIEDWGPIARGGFPARLAVHE